MRAEQKEETKSKEKGSKKKKSLNDSLIHHQFNSSNLHIFSIITKELLTFEVNDTFPYFPGYCHLPNALYFAGG